MYQFEIEDIAFIKQQYEYLPQLCHASNVLTKCGSCKNQKEYEALSLLLPEYVNYLHKILEINSYDEKSIKKKVRLLNGYYNFMHENNLENSFSSQGKFRPTILEEFLFILFKDYIEEIKDNIDKDDVLNSGSVKAYSNIYFKAKNFKEFVKSPVIGVNEKDQDYAIYRTFDISVNKRTSLNIRIPAVAIEAKTYIDKTMLDSIIATAEKIKSGNPHTRFVAVAERYDVSYAVDPAYSRIDQIYVLRKSMRKGEWQEIDEKVICTLFDDTIAHLERPWADIETKIKKEGLVM